MKRRGIVLVLVATALAGCGDTSAPAPAPKRTQADPCKPVAKSLRAAIRRALTVQGTLGQVAAVKSKDSNSAYPGGLWFLSARVDADGGPLVLTWAADRSAIRTGSGTVVAADAGARKWSHLGDRADAGDAGPGSDGWDASRSCVGA